MLDTISDKEQTILNNLFRKTLRAKRRGPDSFYTEGSFILYNDEGIFYSAETLEKLLSDIAALMQKLQNFQRLLEDFKPKAEALKS